MSVAWRQPRVARPSAGFDFTAHARLLCDDLVARLEPLRHIDMARVAMSFSQTRRAGPFGMYASLTPLRFAGGQMTTIRRGRTWGLQRVVGPDGRDMLYILNFYLPRFLNLPFEEKLTTVVHELWHIGPRFDGDLRRFGGRCYAHSASQERYDAHVRRLVDCWLASNPPEPLYAFLRLDFGQLTAHYGRIYGRRVRAPKLIPQHDVSRIPHAGCISAPRCVEYQSVDSGSPAGARLMRIRFCFDPDTGEPHIRERGVTEEEVRQVLCGSGEESRAARGARMKVGQTAAGRHLQVIYVPDEDPESVFVITAYELRGKAKMAFRRRQRRKPR